MAEEEVQLEDGGMGLFDEERNVEFLAFEGYEVKHAEDLLLFRYNFCDAVRMEPELRIDLSRYRHLVTALDALTDAPSDIEKANHIRGRLRRMDRAVRAIGLVYLSWFYMRFYCPRIVVRAGPRMSPRELSFWREHIYLRSLGEFYFVNKLDFRDGVEVVWEDSAGGGSEEECSDDQTHDEPGHERVHGFDDEQPWWETKKPRGVLVPLGGGKDSLLAFEILKEAGVPLMWFYMAERYGEFNRNWRLSAIVRASAAPPPNAVEKGCAPQSRSAVPYATLEGLRELEFRDKLWNSSWREHIAPQCPPWAAMVAFSSVLVALLNDFDFIAVGNEKSANFGNTTYLGMEINHQYDKSLVFERECNQYIREFIADDVYYFSVLQPLWEVEIMRRFLREGSNSRRHYLHLFISCNFPLEKEGSRWCANCPKCCFVFLLLSAYLPPHEVWSVFGDNLLERESLFGIFDELLGSDGKMKPLECVGTDEEVRHCIALARRQYREHFPSHPLPAFFHRFGTSEEDEAGASSAAFSHDHQPPQQNGESGGESEARGGEARRIRESIMPRWCWSALFSSSP